MKRQASFLLIAALLLGFGLTGCGGQETPTPEEPVQEQTEPAEVSTLQGEFEGLADGHSVEITVDGEPITYQFYDDAVAASLETMETGATIQFDVTEEESSELPTIVKVYDTPAEG